MLFKLPKNDTVNNMNDLRPVTLISCVVKVFEKCVMPNINEIVGNFLDTYTFKAERRVENAILHVYALIDKTVQ